MQVEVLAPEYDGLSEEDFAMLQGIYALMKFDTMEEAAEAAGVSWRTLYRWKKTARWQELRNKAQNEIVTDARGQLVGMVNAAVRKLRKLQEDSSGKGAPTEAAIAWGVLDRVGVEVQAQQAEGVRRILTRVPREVAPPTPVVQQGNEQPASIDEERPVVRIVSKRLT